MRIENLPSEDYIRSVTRPDGHQVRARDTGNCYEYAAGSGWIQFMPIDGIEGQPLVGVATDLVPDLPITRKTRIEFGSQNHLVPLGGDSGQIAKLDEYGHTQVAVRDDAGATALPVDFADGGLHTITSRVVNSGSLGPNGFARCTIIARVITNAGRTVNFSFESLNLNTPNLTSSVNTHVLRFEVLLVNQNDITLQSITISLEHTLFVSGGSTSTSFDKQMQSYVSNVKDTEEDWLFTFQTFASGVITGTALVDVCLVEYGYIP